jgi:hypothetical protein
VLGIKNALLNFNQGFNLIEIGKLKNIKRGSATILDNPT